MSDAIRNTPLAACHEALGARIIPFAGWNLPVEYSGLLKEHHATRSAAGLFDISHMGQVAARGSGASTALESLLANDAAKLKDGEGHYTFLTNSEGGVIDDLFLYRIHADDFLLVVNASRHLQVLQILQDSKFPDVTFSGAPGTTAGMALQGPHAEKIVQAILPKGSLCPKRNHFLQLALEGGQTILARTGYTGEDGFEFFTDPKTGVRIWNSLIKLGKPMGLLPCGLGSRDSLRLEAGFPLNGQDLSPEITPIEAGLGFFVDLNRPRNFPGRARLEELKKNSPKITVGLLGQPKQAPPRHGYPVYLGSQQIGVVTSGLPSPTLGLGIALALVQKPAPACGQDVEFEVRGRRVPAKVCSRKFLSKK